MMEKSKLKYVEKFRDRFPVTSAYISRFRRNGPRFQKTADCWRISDHSGSIYAPDLSRYSLYTPSVSARVEYMRERYPFSDISGALVIDVGAHIGEYAVSVAPFAAKIISFEPDPSARRALTRNVANFSNVEVQHIAVSNENRTAKFYVATEGANSSLFQPRKFSRTIDISARRIDSLGLETIGYRSILLKMDAEGFEPEALEGCGEWLQNVTEAAIDVAPERGGNSTYIEVKQLLEKAGLTERNLDRRAHVLWATRVT